MRRRPRQNAARRTGRLLSIVVFTVLATAGIAFAWSIATTNPGNSISSLTVAAPTGLNAVKVGGTANRCNGIDVSWTAAAAPADSYQVDVKSGLGAWTTLTSDTGGATTYADPATYINVEVTYRVYTRIDDASGSLSQWLSPPTEFAILCNQVGDVIDLAGTVVGCNAELTWTPATNADSYDIQRSINGGANWTTLAAAYGNASTNSYTVTAALSGTVHFRIRPIAGGANGEWSNVAQVDGMGFYVTSIALGGDGDNTLESGETITVTFNRAADTTRPSGTGFDKINIRRAGASGLYISSNGNAIGDSGIGRLDAAGFVNASNDGEFGGTTSWNGTTDTWTWTKGAGTVTFSSTPSWTGFTTGTSATTPSPVRCSDLTMPLGDSTPSITGAF